ncbi:MAG: ATP-binding cassette domain-containing protein [Clostridiales bacterium]|nr:ATP-binding cassette domain-containing protein [Clostridiales bacterium]
MGELIRVENLKKYFPTPGGMLHAVDDVSFSINEGETLGVVGESGCGKSTLGRVVLKLIEPTDGRIYYRGQDITDLKGKSFAELRKKMQIVFQDPYSSLNPRLCVSELIADPLKANRMLDRRSRQEKVYELMDMVGLSRRFAFSYPHELDGGRRQRIGIARALVLDPDFIVCDEPVSALDVSIQAQILNLLQDLQQQRNLTYIFVTHDLSVVRHISTNIMVMYVGVVVEKCEAKELFKMPLHPYTKGLLSAIPIPSIDVPRNKVELKGELTSPVEPKNECRFVARCKYASDLCRSQAPKFEEVLPNHFVSCHHVKEINHLA